MTTKYTKDYTDKYTNKKNEIISKVHKDLDGFGSVRERHCLMLGRSTNTSPEKMF